MVILAAVTKKTAISLPDDLYRDIEHARKRAGKDRSLWLQEAAGEYLKKRTKEEEIEAWLSAEERFPPTEDEKAFHRWQEKNWGKLFKSPPARIAKARRRWTMRPTEHGELWQARVDKLRPVVVVSRDDLRGRRTRTTVASVTTKLTDIPSAVLIDHRDGLPEASVVNCDELVTIPKTALVRRIGRLSADRREALDHALLFALQLR